MVTTDMIRQLRERTGAGILDAKNALDANDGDIEKAIQKSDLGLTPNNDGKAITLKRPELTQDRRQDLVKSVKKKGEDKKIILRNYRREANEQVKKDQKDGSLTEDQSKQGQEKIQKLLDSYISKIDEVVRHKEEDVLSV